MVIKNHFDAIGIKSPGAFLSANDQAGVESVIRHLHFQCKLMEMPNSTDRLWRFELRFERESNTNSSVMAELQTIHTAMHYELDTNYFVRIPNGKINLFESDNLFGETVFEKFPSAQSDIKAAGNCLSLDLSTATVFHLMRVVERGLRAFARDLHVPIPKSELEYKNWQTILDQIPKAIAAKLSKKMSSKRRSELLEFYKGVTGQFEFFKDVWRNHCTHSRVHYDHNQAQSAFDHAKDFMQRLATRISETK